MYETTDTNGITADLRGYDRASGDPVDGLIDGDDCVGGRVDLTDADGMHIAAVVLVPDEETPGSFIVTIYRDVDFPLSIRTVDYFPASLDHAVRATLR